MDRHTTKTFSTRHLLLCGAAALLCGFGTASAQGAGQDAARAKLRRVVVNEFQWATTQTPVQKIFDTNIDVGRGIQAVMVTRLVEAGKVRVIERKNFDELVREQDLCGSDRIQRGTCAQVGKGYGADIHLFGDILVFGRDDKKKGFGGGGISFGLPVGAGIGFGKKDDKAVVVISYRLVDVETNEVIATGQARGEAKRGSKGIKGIGLGSGGLVGGAIDMTSSNFQQTIIGEAVTDATTKLAVVVNEKLPNLPRRMRYVEALVADVSGSQITLNRGSADGVEVGDRFEVFRIVKEIKDPVTHEVLDSEVAKLGEMLVVSVRDKIAVGTYSGTGAATGSAARKIMP